MLANLFHLDLTILEKVVRTVVVYFFLVGGLRLAGKRELAQLNPFDLVVLLTLSNALQNAIIGNDNSLLGGIIGAATLLVLNHLVVRFLYDHEKIESIVGGDADVLIENGKIRKNRLKKELITTAALEAAAHRQGFASLKDVDRAILETGGTISFFARKPEPDVARHAELLARLDALSQEVGQLKAALGKAS
jgi:uncharacterized membrane protein YcaP (DUF421 family)